MGAWALSPPAPCRGHSLSRHTPPPPAACVPGANAQSHTLQRAAHGQGGHRQVTRSLSIMLRRESRAAGRWLHADRVGSGRRRCRADCGGVKEGLTRWQRPGGPSRCRQGRSAQRLLSQGPLIYVIYLVTYIISLNFLNWCGLQPSDPIPGGRVLRADLPPRRRQELPAARPPVCARSLPSPRGKEGARHAAPHAQPPLSPRAPAHVKGLGDSEGARAR